MRKLNHQPIINTESNEDIKALIEDIEFLKNQSFEGWSADKIKGYLIACETINCKALIIKNKKIKQLLFPPIQIPPRHRGRI